MDSKPTENNKSLGGSAIWKYTMNDGQLPICFQSNSLEEQSKVLKKNGFKKLEDFSDSFITKKIGGIDNSKTKIFSDKDHVYSKSCNSYVQVKSYDKETKIYTCKEVKNDGSPVEEKKLPKDDLSKFIMVRVN